jgi:putative SOS response-associated peptidase YedK
MDALARRVWVEKCPQTGRELFGFLTTEANAAGARVHPKAMPVILRTPGEFDLWLEGDLLDALMLQLPLPDDALRFVARAEKVDGPSPN